MINTEQNNGIMSVSYVNDEGNIDLIELKIPESEKFKWVYSNKPNKLQYRSWDDKYIKKVKSKFLLKYRISEFLNSQAQEIQDTIFSMNIPKTYFIDIETESIDEFPDINNPKNEIYTISIANEKNQIVTLSTKSLNTEQIKSIKKRINTYLKGYGTFTFKFIHFQDEFRMLYAFLGEYVPKMACLTGWNFINFDWAYIMARSTLFKIDNGITSPSGVLKEKVLKDSYGKTLGKVKIPLHRIVVDYMEVYKKWDQTVAIKESDGLDYVSEQVLGLPKIKYSGTLQDLYERDFETYVYYNAIDAILVKLIHDKINSLAPYFALNYISRVEHDKVFSPVQMTENILIMYLAKENKVLIEREDNSDSGSYEGGFVFPSVKGFHQWILTLDYASLYPTTIRQFNISPDVFLGKSLNFDNKDDKIIHCSSGAMFDKTKLGVLPNALTEIYKQRKDYKKIYGEIENEILQLKKILKTK